MPSGCSHGTLWNVPESSNKIQVLQTSGPMPDISSFPALSLKSVLPKRSEYLIEIYIYIYYNDY